jgi:hypothetical protein
MKLVRVTWRDAEDPTSETWVTDDELDAMMGECLVTSVGYIARESDRYILFVADWIQKDHVYGRVTKIPARHDRLHR